VRNASRDRVAGPECGEVKTWDGWDGKGSGKVGRGRWEVGRGVRVEGGMEGWREGGMEGWRDGGSVGTGGLGFAMCPTCQVEMAIQISIDCRHVAGQLDHFIDAV